MSDSKEMLAFIAKSLVDDPDAVEVTQIDEGGGDIVLQLRVAQGDMGKVIGRQGRTAKDIRTVVRAASDGVGRIKVDIVDD